MSKAEYVKKDNVKICIWDNVKMVLSQNLVY